MFNWPGETCVVVASGPTAADAPLDLARGRARCIAINNSWQLAPWADVLYAADDRWWLAARGAPEFAGRRLTPDRIAAQRYGLELVHFVRGYYGFAFDTPGHIGQGGHSGFHAINLAAQAGIAKLILVGFDMRLDRGGHWHRDHAKVNPTAFNMKRWAKNLDEAAPQLFARGLSVINTSPVSALRAFPVMSLEEALNEPRRPDRDSEAV